MRASMMLRHKYRAKPTSVNGVRYASKREAAYAQQLDLLKRSNVVLGWCEQVPFRLPGGITYRLDFLVFYTDGSAKAVEVKGFETKEWIMKKKLMDETYPWLELEVVR